MEFTRSKVYFFLVVIIALAFLSGIYDFEERYPFKLGLDLQGGTHLVYQADLSGIDDKSDAMTGVRDVIERRVNLFGVAEPRVQISGQDRLIVELAGIKDTKQAIAMIGLTPSLDFRKEIQTEEGEIAFEYTGLTGRQLKRSDISFDPTTFKPSVGLYFDSEGKDLFAELTKEYVGKRIAIFLDGAPISVPVVNEPILDGQAVISGDFSVEEAKTLAQRLNAGALPVPINLISQQTIGASLGKDSLDKSLKAGLYGLLAVALFMFLFYRLRGIAAVSALLIYGALLLAIFKLLPVTLTLAGMAGVILSIGMAVDANVLVFERLKEESRIADAFKRAWPAIRDGNISTLITCLILYFFTTGLVKGFALTLGIGVLLSMFSAMIVTRLFLELKK